MMKRGKKVLRTLRMKGKSELLRFADEYQKDVRYFETDIELE